MDTNQALMLSLLLLFAWVANAAGTANTFNVNDFGAVSDGIKDSTVSFMRAWNEACGWAGQPTLLIPKGTFLVGPIKLKGPCNGQMVVQIEGTILAPIDLSVYPTTDWIHFQYIDGLLVTGGGNFDGQGVSAWPQNRCSHQKHCNMLPTSIKFSFVTNATVRDISSTNSKQFHMLIFASKNMNLEALKITAPGDSPNTDGIHIGKSNNIAISNSIIGTGDDCISIGADNTNVSISNVLCGPGHGISVGSLGKTPGEGNVIGLTVKNCTFTNTTNGLRIKSWEGYPVATLATNFTFEDIVMMNVDNPIIIDQKYCPNKDCGHKSPSMVQIRNIKFRNITGTSTTKVAINLLCSKAVPCQSIELNNIKLEYMGSEGAVTASCANAKGTSIGRVFPRSCI